MLIMHPPSRSTAVTSRSRPTHLACLLLAMVLCAAPAPKAALAQPADLPSPFPGPAEKKALNSDRVGIITGLRVGTYAQIGEQLAQVLDGGTRPPFRVVVTLGRGSLRNLNDLINMPGIDLALVQSDVMEAYRTSPADYRKLRENVRVVATLHQEVIHVLARGAGLDRLEALEGRRVNIDARGSGSNLTARTLFGRLGIRPDFDEGPASLAKARLTAGSLDALVYVTATMNDLFRTISFEEADRAALHFIPIPAERGTMDGYVPARITHADYPYLVPADRPVSARAAIAVLAVVGWKASQERYPAAVRFVDLFFSRAAQLVQPGTGFSRAWCQADLGGSVAGWDRFEVADEWLARRPDTVRRLAQVPGADCR